MATHKYAIGTQLSLVHRPMQQRMGTGPFKVLGILPAENGECSYRVRDPAEPFERVLRESQVSLFTSDADSTFA